MPSDEGFRSSVEDRRLDAAASRLLRAHEEGRLETFEESGDADDAALRRAWDVFGDVGTAPKLLSLRQAALSKAARNAQGGWRRHFAANTRSGWIGVAVATLAVIGSGAAYLSTRAPDPQMYETHLGERRTVMLPDASRIVLDEASRVSVVYARRFRDLELLKGQAEFDVVKDPLRPFSVSSGDWRVVATGTLFDVDMPDRQLVVTLLRGDAVVAEETAGPGRASVIPLKPSQRLTVERSTGVARKTNVDATIAGAWKLGKLMFEQEPLDRAVARVNRYSSRQITLAAWEHARAPISGVFETGDIDGFAGAVSAQLPVRAERRETGLALVPK